MSLEEQFKAHQLNDSMEFGKAADDRENIRIELNKKIDALSEIVANNLASKDDIMELKQILKSVNIVVGGVRFSFNNASKIGSFFLFIGAIFLFFKFGFIAVIHYILGR